MNQEIMQDRDFKLWTILYQARDTILKIRKKELYKYDLSFMQASVLFAIEANGGKASMNDLSKWIFRGPNNTYTVVTRMVRDGLLSKSKVSGKNANLISLTDKGREAYERSLKIESIREVLSCLSEEERKQLWVTLGKLRDKALKSVSLDILLPFP